MEHHGHVVLGQDDVLLDEVRPQRVGVSLGDQGVLREVPAGAAVGDHDGTRWLREGGQDGSQEQDGQGTRAHRGKGQGAELALRWRSVSALKAIVSTQQTIIVPKTPPQPQWSAIQPTPAPAIAEPKT